jgi:hypothetical protein
MRAKLGLSPRGRLMNLTPVRVEQAQGRGGLAYPSHLRSSIHLISACEPRPSAASIAALNARNAWSLDMRASVRGCLARSAHKPLTARVKSPLSTQMSARCFAPLRCSSRPFTSGWRCRAEIEVVLLLQSSDYGHHVDKLDLRRPHFRFDSVQLP